MNPVKTYPIHQNGPFETGAHTHAINELILFADGTEKLVEKRYIIYTQYNLNQNYQTLRNSLEFFYKEVIKRYVKEVKYDGSPMNIEEGGVIDFINIYANRFKEWKKEKERNPE